MSRPLRKSARWPVVLALVAVALASSAARASVLWRGDFSTGDLSQWNSIEALANRLTVVTSPAHTTSHTMRVELHSGDIVFNGCRAEVDGPFESAGAERYYAWSTLFPTDYPTAASSDWQVFTQWHHTGNFGGSPPLEFDLGSNQIMLLADGATTLWSAPLVLGVWHDFIFHVKFSPDAAVGFVEVWLDGKQALAKTYRRTMYAGAQVYLKQGLYRKASITQTAVIYHAGMIEGETLQDVTLAPSPVPLPTADFALSVTPASQSVQQGNAVTYGISIAPSGGFSNEVPLGVSGLPTGATASFQASSPTSATLTVRTDATATVGTSTLAITGTAGGITHSVTATLAISAGPPLPPPPPPAPNGFTLSSNAAAQSATNGASTDYVLAIARSQGFTDLVTLTATGLPPGATAASTATTSTAAIVTVTVAPDAAAGTYPFTIAGTNGSLTQTAAATLIILPASAVATTTLVQAGGCASSGAPFLWEMSVLALLLWRRRFGGRSAAAGARWPAA